MTPTPKTPSEVARELAARDMCPDDHECGAYCQRSIETRQAWEIDAALAQARAEGRREGIEEAAKVADAAHMEFRRLDEAPLPYISFSPAGRAAAAVASRIRALLDAGKEKSK